MFIGFSIKTAKIFMTPVGKGGPFIVDEKAPVADGRLFREILVAVGQEKFLVPLRPDRRPVDKGGDPQHLREMEEAVDRSSFVTARNDQRLVYPFPGGVDNLEQIYFIFSPELFQGDQSLPGEVR